MSMVEGGINMTRYECEDKILEKLKEIREIVKEYDDSHEGALYIELSNKTGYISVYNSSSIYRRLNTAIDFVLLNEEVIHYGN